MPSTRYRSILLFGAPGSGKGTQGKIIGQIPGFLHSSTGDIFRSLDLHSETGRQFWEYAGKGKLVPDAVTIKVWRQYIKGLEYTNQFYPETQMLVLDGLPRTTEQARLLEDTIEVEAIVHLHCSDLNKMIERLRRRALKENRFDDANDAVIRKRLETYERDTRPVLDYYPASKIKRVEATQSQIRVLHKLLEILVPLKEKMDLALAAREGVAVPPPPPPPPAATGPLSAEPLPDPSMSTPPPPLTLHPSPCPAASAWSTAVAGEEAGSR